MHILCKHWLNQAYSLYDLRNVVYLNLNVDIDRIPSSFILRLTVTKLRASLSTV